MKATSIMAQADCVKFVRKHEARMAYLYERWRDERGYEDFKEYELELSKLAATWPAITFRKGTRRPFGFVATYLPLNRPVEFIVSARGLGYRFPPMGGAK